MEINQAIRIFASFLNVSWDIVIPLLSNRAYTTDQSSIGDWLQSNWEMLVERKVLNINEYLEIYSDGADYNRGSSRMNDIESMPTHTLRIFIDDDAIDILSNEIIRRKSEFVFERLVGFQNGFYVDVAPFNYALALDGETERLFKLENVKFELIKISQ